MAERSAERRQALHDFGKPLPCRLLQRSAGTTVVRVIALDDPFLFGIEPEPVGGLPDRIDPAEQGRVGADLIPVPGKARCHLALDRQQCIVGGCTGEQMEQVVDAFEALPAAFERINRVGQCRRRRVAGDGRDVRLMLGECACIGGREVLGGDTGERRNAGASPVLQQWIAGERSGRGSAVGRLGLLVHFGHREVLAKTA